MPKGSEEAYSPAGRKSHGMTDEELKQGHAKTPIPERDKPGMHQPEYRKGKK